MRASYDGPAWLASDAPTFLARYAGAARLLGMLILAWPHKVFGLAPSVHWFGEMHIKLGRPCAFLVCSLSNIAFTTILYKVNSERNPPGPPRFRGTKGKLGGEEVIQLR
ncbi:MAG: hypothetical protein JWR60_2388 [Polaromonas sp.]|nr:hypothetical protein [Polaromonas sp.]